MSAITIYATGVHKQKLDFTSYCLGILKGRAKKPKEIIGQLSSKSRAESQLNILLYAIQLATEDSQVEEIKVISDLPQIIKITDGTIDQWESEDWLKNKKPIPQADLWKEIFTALQKFDLTFLAPEEGDTKMEKIVKSAKEDSIQKKTPTAIFEEVAETSVEIQEEVPEVSVQEMDEPPVNTAEETPMVEVVEEVVPLATENPVAEESNYTSLQVSKKLAKDCEILFEEIGLDVETAVTMFLKASLRKKGLTLDLTLED